MKEEFDDDAIQKENWKLKRTKELGFRPQNELFYNIFLPSQITQKLDEESKSFLNEIKNNLGLTIASKEINPGIGIYVSKLLAYIKLYGLKFTKEDHLAFVKVLLELIVIPHLDPARLNKLCVCLSQLLRKSNLLSPDDLQIEWRPLYDLCKIYINKRSSKGDLVRYFPIKRDDDDPNETQSQSQQQHPLMAMLLAMAERFGLNAESYVELEEPNLEQNLHFVIQLCTLYFPKSSSREILDEVLPYLQPLDTGKSCSVFEMLSLFLNPNYYELWFEDFMNIWETYHYPPWNADIMNLIASLATNTIGLIDWSPYIPTMFTRILRSMDLPVCYKQMRSAKNQNLCSSASAAWIVSVIGPQTDAMKYLRSFMSTIESYLHPANAGKWVRTISELLVQLPRYLFDRLISERYRKHPWKRQIPDSHKLRDCDITEFVEIFKPIAFQAMFSRLGGNDISKVFKHLADLRPELILPGIIERVFTTLDSITEPHKFTASLQCLASVSGVLVSGRRGTESSKTQVIPLLMAVLPGIDSNDFKKTTLTLQYIIAQSILIPFVDCSKASLYYDDLTEDEHLICEQTAMLEDFVLQFLDRVFVLIEASSQESIRMEQSHMDSLKSKLETISEALIQSSAHSILGQCSQEILDSASRKLINYVKTHLFEPRVSGAAISTLCRVFARVNGKEIYRALIPYLVQSIDTHFDETDDAIELEKQSDEFLYYLVLLSNLVRGNAVEIQNYIDDIIPIIDKLLKCKCKLTNRSGVNLLTNLLTNLSTIQTSDVKTCPEAYTKPLKEFLPIRHWGKKMHRDERFQWTFPGVKEQKICERLVHRYLVPILDKFQRYVKDEEAISRDDLHLDLVVITGILKCNTLLPNWIEEPLKLFESVVVNKPYDLTLGFENIQISMPDGSNIRMTIVKNLDQLQAKILSSSEDDIKSLKQLLAIYEKVHCRRHSNSSYDSQLKSFQVFKMFQEYKLTKCRKDIRAVIATRIIIQQDLRDEISTPLFTPTHKLIMFNLIKLATSHYSAVRCLAQAKLFGMFGTYSFAYKTVLDEIVMYMGKDPNVNHEEFKGALYMIGTNRKLRLILRRDWECVEKLWIAMLKTQLSEKLSILRLTDTIIDAIYNEFQTLATEITVSDKIAKMGYAMICDKNLVCDETTCLAAGEEKMIAKNIFNREKYLSILQQIFDHVNKNSLHWRYNLMAGSMVHNLVHPLTDYPPEVTKHFVQNLIHDSIEERKLAIKIIDNVLKQQKREHIKRKVDPFQISGLKRDVSKKLPHGIRPDNQWMQYDVDKIPKNQSEWDEPRYIFKINGYFGWTPDLEVYAPSCQQPKLDRSVEEMSEHERHLFNFFSQKCNVDKLFEYWSLEEKKGKDKFNRSRFFLIKSIFDMFGDMFLDIFLVHMQPLIENKTNESGHRCVSEIMSGIMRGAKHWPYDKTEKLYDQLKPLIRLALANITNETDGFWGTGFATATENMDPMRQHFLHEVLLEDPVREATSFIDCSRLYCLQGAFNQHVWRMGTVAQRLLNYLRPYLNHQFQNVRERIGSTLINIFEGDLLFDADFPSNSPKMADMLSEVKDDFELLYKDENLNLFSEAFILDTNSQYAISIRLFKTIAQWVTGILNRCTNGNETVFFDLLPVGCRLERCEQDTELAETCSAVLSMISQGLTLPKCMDHCLLKVEEVSYMSSWSARLAIIDILQVLVFHNMAIVLSEDKWVEKVQSIVLRLLEDNVLEVREKSAEVLGGLLHCSFLPSTDKLLELFKKKCRTKVIKRSNRVTTCSVEANNAIESSEAVRVRHSGVLGLCAFISAYPYDIPDFVPNVFEIISNHLNDPQPIPTTIRKTLADFKRTHHDNWDYHQSKFNENQLAVLTDLTVPPSYYA